MRSFAVVRVARAPLLACAARPIHSATSVGMALLLAATTAATASADTEWHKVRPDGAQVRGGYSLTEAFSDKGVWYSNFTPEPSGDSFLALRTTLADDVGDWTTGIVRFVPDDDGQLTASVVLDLEQLRESSPVGRGRGPGRRNHPTGPRERRGEPGQRGARRRSLRHGLRRPR